MKTIIITALTIPTIIALTLYTYQHPTSTTITSLILLITLLFEYIHTTKLRLSTAVKILQTYNIIESRINKHGKPYLTLKTRNDYLPLTNNEILTMAQECLDGKRFPSVSSENRGRDTSI
jgi:hypothetical protein